MRRYETIFILRPSMGEEQITTLIDNTTKIIQSDNGVVIGLDKWGVKKLAYPIKKETLGFYVFFDFAGSPEAVSEIERKFRIDDSVLRYLTVKITDSITSSEAEAAITEIASRKAAAQMNAEKEQEENQEDETEDESDSMDE